MILPSGRCRGSIDNGFRFRREATLRTLRMHLLCFDCSNDSGQLLIILGVEYLIALGIEVGEESVHVLVVPFKPITSPRNQLLSSIHARCPFEVGDTRPTGSQRALRANGGGGGLDAVLSQCRSAESTSQNGGLQQSRSA